MNPAQHFRFRCLTMLLTSFLYFDKYNSVSQAEININIDL